MNSEKLEFKSYGNPCPCGDSSDAFAENTDGSGKCFSCGKFFPKLHENEKRDRMTGTAKATSRTNRPSTWEKETTTLKWQYAGVRGVSKDAFEFYGCKVGVDEDGPAVLGFPHPNGRTLIKDLRKKDFYWTGEKTGEGGDLFGMDKFPAGSAKSITICEGGLDAVSLFDAFDRRYPSVAVKSAQSAKSECSAAYDYLNSFEKIYLCFDSDKPGQEAARSVARLFDFNKVYVVNLARKDVNEYIEAKDVEVLKKTWWAAQRFMPEGILASYSEFDDIIDNDVEKPSISYPWETLQEMSYGIRTGELVLLTALEGRGKTEFFRAIEYHLLKTTDENIGIIHLEENKARTLKGLVGYELKSPIHLPTHSIPKDEIKKNLRKITGRDERVHIYSHYGSDDPDVILSTVRFMAGACGCKRIFLDHITMVVSGLAGDDERRALDYISTRLAMMTEELDFTLFLISHVNDEGQTRGSQ
jgi:twinkle protein